MVGSPSLILAFVNFFLVENGSAAEVKKKILEAILAMCSHRILCRLRLISSKRNRRRPSIKDVLQKAIDGLQSINPDKVSKSNLTGISSSFTTESKNVIQLVTHWSNHQVQSRLLSLVEGIYRVHKIQDLPMLLRLIASSASGVTQDPHFASSLLNIISKVSRYVEAAKFLYHVAKKFTLVRYMEPQLAVLPREVYDRLKHPGYSPSLSNTVSLLGLANGRRFDLSQVSRFIKSDRDKTPAQQFSVQTKKTLEEAKIHAEIQLIAYCEIKSPRMFPRVIGSSKDACFLCNTFIEQHGKMHTSRTHGRLYPGWRIPTLLQFKAVEERFNRALMDKARQTIEARSKGRAPLHPYPNESTLLPLSVSATTASTVHRQFVKSAPEEATPTPFHSISPASVEASPAIANPSELESPLTDTIRVSSSDSVVACRKLKPGEPFSGSLSPKRPSPLFVAGPLEVQIHVETESTAESKTDSFAYSIEWIELGVAKHEQGRSLLVDPLTLEGETSYELPKDDSIFIALQDVTLKIICCHLAAP